MDLLLDFIVKLSFFFIIYLLPGSRLVRRRAKALYFHERFLYSLIASILMVGCVFYLIAMTVGYAIPNVHFQGGHVAFIATAIAGAIEAINRLRPRLEVPEITPLPNRKRVLIGACALTVGLLYAFNFEDGNYAECIYSGTLANLANIDMMPEFFKELMKDQLGEMPDMSDRLTGLFAANGQREGSIYFLISFVPTYKLFGFNLAYLLIHSMIFLAAFSLVFRLFGRYGAALITGLVFTAHPILVGRKIMDENVMTFLSVLLWFNWMLVRPVGRATLGLLLAWNVALMHEFTLPLGAFAAAHWAINRWPLRKAMAILPSAALVYTPVWLHHIFAVGFLKHESFTQFAPIPHSFLGFDFQWRGMLNWPFYHEIVRTPFTAFPTFLLFPAYILKYSGYLMMGAFLAGIAWFLAKKFKTAFPYILFAATICSYLGVQSNWMETKKMGVALHFMAVFVIGFGFLLVLLEDAKLRKKALVSLAAACLALFGGKALANRMHFPADPRTELYLPELHSIDQYQTILDNYDEWLVIANAPETPDVYDFERRYLANVSLLPSGEYFPKMANHNTFLENVSIAMTDFVYSGFEYYEPSNPTYMIESLVQLIPKDAYEILRRKSGGVKKTARRLGPKPASVVKGKKGETYLELELTGSWFSSPPVVQRLERPDRSVHVIDPSKTTFLIPREPSANGYYRICMIEPHGPDGLGVVAFYVKDPRPNRFKINGASAVITHKSRLVWSHPYPGPILVMEMHRLFPGKSYTWEGFVSERGEFHLVGPIHQNE